HGFTPQFGPDLRRDSQHAQARGMAAFVIRGELRGIVLVFVEEPERNKPPVDRVPGLGHHFDNPAGRDPGKGADRIPEEFDVIRLHPWPFVRACSLPLCDALAVWSPPTSRSIVPHLPLLSMTELRRRYPRAHARGTC